MGTPEITLRPLTVDDLEAVLVWRNDPEVSAHLARRSTTAERLRAWFDSLDDAAGNRAYAIVADGELIGYGTISGTDLQNGRTEAGLVIGRKEWWGRGVGTAAARELARIAFDEIGVHRVLAVASELNPASVRCFSRAGYKEEGRLREAALYDDGYHDLVLLSILEDEIGSADRSASDTKAVRVA